MSDEHETTEVEAGEDAVATEEESTATFQPLVKLEELPEIQGKDHEDFEDVIFQVYVVS